MLNKFTCFNRTKSLKMEKDKIVHSCWQYSELLNFLNTGTQTWSNSSWYWYIWPFGYFLILSLITAAMDRTLFKKTQLHSNSVTFLKIYCCSLLIFWLQYANYYVFNQVFNNCGSAQIARMRSTELFNNCNGVKVKKLSFVLFQLCACLRTLCVLIDLFRHSLQ